MASSSSHSAAAALSLAQRSTVFSPAGLRAAAPGSGAPPGTFAPGTKVQVGNHRVIVEKYLSEGGFAHVYVVRVPRSGGGSDVAVLKRVAVPDRDTLANMRTEVDTMKRLKGHKHIVTYIDSHASQLKGGGYEVFLLMEYCAGGGLIDFMNTRLQHRLTEPEILKIISDCAEGVARMHYLKPPLLHRDLKVENVLISTHGDSKLYKLCDFGSAAAPRAAATTAAEGRQIEDDVQRHTTLQYRSPEMIDVYRNRPIDEKSDIWALGVLLYKLCYYTTPFEEQGQMAILNASFKYPHYPPFSDRIKKLIAWMLREDPKKRPNIYEVVREASAMRNVTVSLPNIYAIRSQSQDGSKMKSGESKTSPPVIGLSKGRVAQPTRTIPDIKPMRRGRPQAPAPLGNATSTSRSPLRSSASKNDPFAALDSPPARGKVATPDELSARFPSLDEFSLLHERRGRFDFSQPSSDESTLSKRVTEALADEAFVQPSGAQSRSRPQLDRVPARDPASDGETNSKRTMMSRDTMTTLQSPPAPPGNRILSPESVISPTPHQNIAPQRNSVPGSRTATLSLSRASVPRFHRSASRSRALDVPRSPSSSRLSAERQGPSPQELPQTDTLGRSRSANASAVHVESHLEYLRSRESPRSQNATEASTLPGAKSKSRTQSPPSLERFSVDVSPDDRDRAISDVDFLRSMEDDAGGVGEDSHISSSRLSRGRSARTSSGKLGSGSSKTKRSSMSSISLSGTKHILAGKFGDAFRRFEMNNSTGSSSQQRPGDNDDFSDEEESSRDVDSRNNSNETSSLGPSQTNASLVIDQATLSAQRPTSGSLAEASRLQQDPAYKGMDETRDLSVPAEGVDVEESDLSPEVRRELERRLLAAEERRVAKAGSDYRRRLEAGSSSRSAVAAERAGASSIRSRVDDFASQNMQRNAGPVNRTAEGYGRFTRSPANTHTSSPAAAPSRPGADAANLITASGISLQSSQTAKPSLSTASPTSADHGATSRTRNAVSGSDSTIPAGRPRVAPKPQGLRPTKPKKPANGQVNAASGAVSATGSGSENADDWQANFARRYPSLSGLELVEVDVGSAGKASRSAVDATRES